MLFITGVLGLMVFDITEMDSESMILCTSNEGGIFIPSKVCEYYMFNYRDITKDVEELTKGSGLVFILNGKNKEKKYKIAEFFILKGLDVNGVNHYGDYNLTPLHGAVLSNDVGMVKFLLKHGADIKIKPASINMNPLEFAQSLQKKEPSVDRSKIIKLLHY